MVALGAVRVVKGRVEGLKEGGTVALSHAVVTEDREDGHLLDKVARYGVKKRRS
jgi:hypothetical protein